MKTRAEKERFLYSVILTAIIYAAIAIAIGWLDLLSLKSRGDYAGPLIVELLLEDQIEDEAVAEPVERVASERPIDEPPPIPQEPPEREPLPVIEGLVEPEPTNEELPELVRVELLEEEAVTEPFDVVDEGPIVTLPEEESVAVDLSPPDPDQLPEPYPRESESNTVAESEPSTPPPIPESAALIAVMEPEPEDQSEPEEPPPPEPEPEALPESEPEREPAPIEGLPEEVVPELVPVIAAADSNGTGGDGTGPSAGNGAGEGRGTTQTNERSTEGDGSSAPGQKPKTESGKSEGASPQVAKTSVAESRVFRAGEDEATFARASVVGEGLDAAESSQAGYSFAEGTQVGAVVGNADRTTSEIVYGDGLDGSDRAGTPGSAATRNATGGNVSGTPGRNDNSSGSSSRFIDDAELDATLASTGNGSGGVEPGGGGGEGGAGNGRGGGGIALTNPSSSEELEEIDVEELQRQSGLIDRPELTLPAGILDELAEGLRSFEIPVQVTINPTGLIAEAHIIRSSGVPQLDAMIKENLRHWKFEPITVDLDRTASFLFVYEAR